MVWSRIKTLNLNKAEKSNLTKEKREKCELTIDTKAEENRIGS